MPLTLMQIQVPILPTLSLLRHGASPVLSYYSLESDSSKALVRFNIQLSKSIPVQFSFFILPPATTPAKAYALLLIQPNNHCMEKRVFGIILTVLGIAGLILAGIYFIKNVS